MPESNLTPPSVLWAQRAEYVIVTIALEDCQTPVIELTKDKLHFRGTGGADKKEHDVTLEFYGEIKVDDSKYVTRARGTEFHLIKADIKQGYWPRLLKDKAKHYWLKVDFNRWKDEDDSDSDAGGAGGPGGMGGLGGAGGADFESLMQQMGGLGGVPPNADFDDLPDDEEEEDEDAAGGGSGGGGDGSSNETKLPPN